MQVDWTGLRHLFSLVSPPHLAEAAWSVCGGSITAPKRWWQPCLIPPAMPSLWSHRAGLSAVDPRPRLHNRGEPPPPLLPPCPCPLPLLLCPCSCAPAPVPLPLHFLCCTFAVPAAAERSDTAALGHSPHPTTRTILQHDGPNHLGIVLQCVPANQPTSTAGSELLATLLVHGPAGPVVVVQTAGAVSDGVIGAIAIGGSL